MSVFIKETKNGDVINYRSEYPEKYKTGTISLLLIELIWSVQIGIVLPKKLQGWNKSL